MKFFTPLLAALVLLASGTVARPNVGEETKNVDQLYADAVVEGGSLVLKYHDTRVDNQLATDTLVPDVVALQTLQDFTHWAKTGVVAGLHIQASSTLVQHALMDTFRWPTCSVVTIHSREHYYWQKATDICQ
ncbi:unnamed protein product [Phytophthora fragariaefolia]|uniref:Unnamed protein product n=1 Tax=Phytophthora fragariaefolia TaxID=1490495 RepID=A0A9W6YNG1_9STRA|nr:unnamed protein product [Phytophthora fragariaefolia]